MLASPSKAISFCPEGIVFSRISLTIFDARNKQDYHDLGAFKMAEFVSAILGFITFGLASWQRIDCVVKLIKNSGRDFEHWRVAGGVLRESLHLMETRIKARQRNWTKPEQNLCEAIERFARDFMTDLRELETTIPTARSSNKWWLPLKRALTEDQQLLTRISRNVQIFQLSASALSLLDSGSAACSGIGVTSVHGFLEGISEKNPEHLNQDERSDLSKWREALYEVAGVAAQREFPDPAANSPPPVTLVTPVGNEIPRRPSAVSDTELRYRFKAAVSRANRMYNAGLPIIAKKAHDEAIQYREQVQSRDENAISVKDLVDMEITYIRIIKSCVPYVKSYEALAWEQLKGLKDNFVKQHGLDINPEFRNELEKIGILCADMRDPDGAIEFLRLSLEAYLPNHSECANKIRKISMLVCEQYECLGDWNALDAFKQVLLDQLKYDITSEPNAHARTIEWCHLHGYQAAEKEGHLDMPEENLNNSTPLHEAAADMTIQPDIIYQLMPIVPHTAVDSNNDTPLLVAVQHSNNTALQALLRISDSVHVWDTKGRTPLHRCDNEVTLKLLLEEIKKPIHHISPEQRTFPLVHIDSTDGYGETALHKACDKGNERMVRLLLEEDANVNLISGSNETPLMLTCAPNEHKGRGKLNRDRQRIFEMLVNRNADAKHPDDRGKPAVPKSLKARGYSDADIDRMLSPDPRRRFTRSWTHARNSDSTGIDAGTPPLGTHDASPVQLTGDIPSGAVELDAESTVPRFTPLPSDSGILTPDASPDIQLSALQGSISGATAVEVNRVPTNTISEPSNRKYLLTGKMKSLRQKMRI